MQQESENIFQSICERITKRMRERRMTRIDLAHGSGVSYRTVYNIVKGKGHPKRAVIEALASVLDCDADFLIEGKTSAPVIKSISSEISAAARNPTTVASAMRMIAQQLELPEHLLWDCLNDAIEKKRKTGIDRVSKAG